jgi:hypothetical protein
MEHLLPRLVCIDENALFSSKDDHSTCLDTTLWDPGTDDSSKLSAQEDIISLTVYNVIQKELASSDGIQWHTRVPSSTIDSAQFSTSSYAERVFGDYGASTSRTNASSEGSEVAPQYDYDQESHHSVAELRVSEDMIRAAIKCTDVMHVVMEDYYWRALVAHGSSDKEISMEDFHALGERVSVMRTDHQQLLTEQDYLLRISDTYHED